MLKNKYIYLVVILLLFVLIVPTILFYGDGKNIERINNSFFEPNIREVNDEKNSESSVISIEQINEDLTNTQIDLLLEYKGFNYITLTHISGEQAMEIGDLLIDNQIFINRIWEPVKYQTIDWKDDPYHDNSWKLYLHGLYPVSFLLNAYEETGDEKYLEKAKEITLDWINNNPNNKDSSEWAWADHAVSMRLITMSYMLEIFKTNETKDYDFTKVLINSIKQHINYQLSEDNYLFPHNHGVMQDRSIIQMALTLSNVKESELWISTAINRLEKQIDSFISESGVHLEHSPFYHKYIIELYSSIEEILDSTDYKFSEITYEKLSKMVDYLVYVTKPNLMLPHIGDTVDTKIQSDYNNNHLRYVISEGLEGVKPNQVDKVYLDAGVAVFRDEWKKGNSYKDMTHVVFQAGYHSNVHKHADDLSIVLSSLGEDILIDAGKYTYTDSVWKDYFMSSKSHNTVTVDNQSYKIEGKNARGSFITDYRIESDYSWIKGEHNLIPGVNYSREILFIKPNNLLIFDNLISRDKHSYQQNFNLGKSFEINESSENYIKASIPNKNIAVSINQLLPVDDVSIFNGYNNNKSKSNPVRGYASERTNELIEINQVEFEKMGKSVEFITLVKVESDSFDTTDIENIQINNKGAVREISYSRNNRHEIISLVK